MGRSTEICGAGEYVAIGRSTGIGRDREIAPTEEGWVLSNKRSRSGDRSYSQLGGGVCGDGGFMPAADSSVRTSSER